MSTPPDNHDADLSRNPAVAAVQKVTRTLMRIEPNELRSTLLSFLFIFILMAAYYILRPVRDAMASDWTDAEVAFLWTLNFFISAGVVALYGGAVSRVTFRRLVPGVYTFFAATFIGFFIAVTVVESRALVDKCFYVWLSVFSLFHISVFWSYMSDTFNKDQATRLFAIIAAGASAGALVGPSIPTLFADALGNDKLMLIAAALLVLPIPIILYLARLKITDLGNEDVQADPALLRIGGNPLTGFKQFLTNPYLLAIGGFILLYTMISSFVYFEQKNILAPYDRETRTRILGGIDWITNALTFGLAFFATGRLVQRFGMAVTLPLLPVLVIAGLLILAFAPIITVLLALQVARRAGNYAVTRPAREMLFTGVDRETRFKAKPVIDIVVYRGGDTLTAWLFAGLSQGLGLGMAAIALVGAGIAAVWAAVGIYLGKWFDDYHKTAPVPEQEENIRAMR
ncbi:MAG: MFS transporter [Gammaproteobacteria bacterium]